MDDKFPIYIYVYIRREGETRKYLLNTVTVDQETFELAQEYAQAFNEMVDEYDINHDENWTKITFEVSLRDEQILPQEDWADEFVAFANVEDNLNYNGFLTGWTREIVDDIFRMNEIRPRVNYSHWVIFTVWFDNDNSLAEVMRVPLRLFNGILERVVSEIIGRIDYPLRLRNLKKQIDIYEPDDIEIVYEDSDDYQPPTFIDRRFLELIFTEATDEELDRLLEIPNKDIKFWAENELDRRQSLYEFLP